MGKIEADLIFELGEEEDDKENNKVKERMYKLLPKLGNNNLSNLIFFRLCNLDDISVCSLKS